MLENRRLTKEHREKKIRIALEYGSSIENRCEGFIRDTGSLPYPKHELLDALLFSIANAPNKQIVEAFSVAAVTLSRFQDGVGPAPITLPGIDIDRPDDLSPDMLLDYLERFDFDRIKRFSTLMLDEDKEVVQLIAQAKAANLHIQPTYKKYWQRFRQKGLYSPFYEGYVDFHHSRID
jgi:hypothetical protein